MTALILILPIKKFYVQNNFKMPENFVEYGLLLANEILIGLAIGFFLGIIFVVFQMAGQFFSIQIGFGISTVIDPLSQIQIPLIGQFQALLGTLVFFAIDGHLQIFSTLLYSFQKLPFINMMNVTADFFKALKWSFVVMFSTALKMALPIIGTLFLTSMCMGLLAKASPQMNILMIGFPIKIGIGFITLIYVLPSFVALAKDFLNQAFIMLYKFFGAVS
jgi:flagellar biosynthetic protein FliR